MLLETKSIPVLTGETAERFIKIAEENEKNPRQERIRFSMEEIKRIANSGKERLKKMKNELSEPK